MNLAMIKATGGELITAHAGTFWALFDNPSEEVLGPRGVESRIPSLVCRLSDVTALALEKEAPLQVRAESYRLKRHDREPLDLGEGMSRLFLKR